MKLLLPGFSGDRWRAGHLNLKQMLGSLPVTS